MKRYVCWLILFSLVLSGCAKQTSVQEENTPVLSWQEQYDSGLRYLSEGNYEEAIIAFTAAIKIDSKRAEAYVGRGDTYVLSGETEENLTAAQADYEKAIELDKTLAGAYLGLANVYTYRGEDFNALQILQQGYGNTDKDENIATKIQKVANRREEALNAYSEFLGANQSVAFSLVDLNVDNIPELVAGPINPYVSPLTISEYTLYTFTDGNVTEIYHDWVDSWHQEIHLLNGNMLMTEGHGTGAYHSNHYFTWDGKRLSNFNLYDGELNMMDNIEEFHPEFNYYWEYPYDKLARGYFKDGVQISQDEYTDMRKRLEKVDEVLVFHVNTPEEQLRILGYSAKQLDPSEKTPDTSDINLYPIDYIGMTVDSMAELWGDDYYVSDHWFAGADKPIYYEDLRVPIIFYVLDLELTNVVHGDEEIILCEYIFGESTSIYEVAPGIPTNATYIQLSNLSYPGRLYENFEGEYGETATYSIEYNSEIFIDFHWFNNNDPRTTQAESIIIMKLN